MLKKSLAACAASLVLSLAAHAGDSPAKPAGSFFSSGGSCLESRMVKPGDGVGWREA